MLNLFLFFFIYLILTISIFGYGLLLKKFFFPNNGVSTQVIDTEYIGIFGVFVSILISYITSFFLPHDIFHNLAFLLFGLIFFFKFQHTVRCKSIKILGALFLIYLINILVFKNHDDFPYYHYPYTYYLVEFGSQIGIGNLNHGFKTPSSIFYLNSLFYLPWIGSYGFNFGQGFIFLFSNYYFIKKIFFDLFPKKNNFLFFFSILSFAFVNIFFYRLGEHGTDRSAQILIFILVIEIFLFKDLLKNLYYNLIKNKLNLIVLLILLICSLKAFYIIYFLFLILVFCLIINKISFINFNKIVNVKFIFFVSIFFLFIFFYYYLNTGCFLFPLEFTCLESSDWSLKKIQVAELNAWYEQWSKAGAGPNYRIEDPSTYIQNFNWVSNWMDKYFFNKVSDFLLGLFFTLIFTKFFFNLKFNNNKYNNVLNFNILLIFLILLIEWFTKHPSLRYGGYVLFASIFFLIFCKFFSNNEKLKKKKIIIFLILILAIGYIRNINRLNHENIKYKYNPIDNVFYQIDDYHLRYARLIKNLLSPSYKCSDIQNCLMLRKFNGKLIFYFYR